MIPYKMVECKDRNIFLILLSWITEKGDLSDFIQIKVVILPSIFRDIKEIQRQYRQI